ncbi:unnamed protein product [Staurois parvus]|uniref:Uncharacterized protein n=1 Tax=Staurois parvus TaxID=386267 RepID=A0ABN9BSQ8_9NEOB|nr:unnamed protein product [Staurois parvus]
MALHGTSICNVCCCTSTHKLPQCISMNGPLSIFTMKQGQTDSSWGPWEIGDHGAPVFLPKLKKAYEKGTRGISWGPLLTPGPRAVPEFPNGQSAPAMKI